MALDLSLSEARRIVLAAQGFTGRRPERVSATQLYRVQEKLGLFQIDSVNVLTRAHYLPAFSRLGSYDRAALEKAAWGAKRRRRMFEYWAHEASLLPLDLHPLLRWRMERAERGEIGYQALRLFATERRNEAQYVLDRIISEGPMAAADFENGTSKSGWWEWSNTKHALEWLFWSGQITTATRRGSFARIYDLTERVLPKQVFHFPRLTPRRRYENSSPAALLLLAWRPRRTCGTIIASSQMKRTLQSPRRLKPVSSCPCGSRAGNKRHGCIETHAPHGE